jgi:hypothetical protein
MNALKKTSLALIAFAISASAFAGTDLETRVHELEKKMDMMSTTTAAETFGPKMALARPEPNGKGWFLTFDVLYWQSKVAGLDYADVVSPLSANAVVSNVSERTPDFDWTFAFKVGIGYKFCHDGWDAHFEYTYYRNTATDSYSTEYPTALSPEQTSVFLITAQNQAAIIGSAYPQYATDGSSSIRLTFNDINLDLGRDYFVSKNLSLRPSFGLKASWITLRGETTYSGGGTAYTVTVPVGGTSDTVNVTGLGPNTVYVNRYQKFVGIGPRASVDSKWHLGNDISFYGDVAGALLFGYFRNTSNGTYSANPTNSFSYSNKFHALVPTGDCELGLVYDKYVMCDTQHFSISLGYETQYFWDINYTSFSGETPYGLGMYGVNLDLRWDF